MDGKNTVETIWKMSLKLKKFKRKLALLLTFGNQVSVAGNEAQHSMKHKPLASTKYSIDNFMEQMPLIGLDKVA